MKPWLLGGVLLAAMSASSADVPIIVRENPALPLTHPFRKVGDKYCDLRPLFKWYEIPVDRRTMKQDGKPTSYPKPLPAWEYIEGKVSQVMNDGLIVKEDGFIEPDRRTGTGIGIEHFRELAQTGGFNPANYAPLTNRSKAIVREPQMLFLTNHPGLKTTAVGDKIGFVALTNAPTFFTNQFGEKLRIPVYDYGVPFDPNRQKQQADIRPNVKE